MPKQGINPLAWMVGSAIVWVFIAGCTRTLEVPTVSFADYRQKEKIRLHVELHLSDNFRNAKSERASGLDKVIIPLGDNLSVNAEFLASAVFTGVAVVKDGAGSVRERVDAVLTPRMISSQRVAPIRGYVRQPWRIAVILEWVLKDPGSNLIWVDTITAEGKVSELSSSGEENRKNLIETLIQDLFRKSYEAISSSPEIRNFAAERTTKNNKD